MFRWKAKDILHGQKQIIIRSRITLRAQHLDAFALFLLIRSSDFCARSFWRPLKCTAKVLYEDVMEILQEKLN